MRLILPQLEKAAHSEYLAIGPQVPRGPADNGGMTISGASSSLDSVAALASGLQGAAVGQQIGVAVLKQIQDAQQAQAQQLLEMMRQTAAVARGGVDRYA